MSCGCLQREAVAQTNMERRDMRDVQASKITPQIWAPSLGSEFKVQVGARVGRLEVVAEEGYNKHRQRVWLCRCSCGNPELTSVRQLSLVSARIRSCGCLRDEATRARSKTHGHAHVGKVLPEYKIWTKMKDRCFNPESTSFHNYGRRGIRVCSEWQDSFEAFLRDMGPRPSPLHSIERKENNGNYEPENCVWATRSEQMANTRRNKHVTYQGEKMHVAEAARKAGLSERTVLSRIRIGWPEERLFIPSKRGRYFKKPPGREGSVFVVYNGERVSLNKAATLAGLKRATVRDRIENGWPESEWFAPANPNRPKLRRS